MKSFTDLTTWQEGHRLVLAVYGATKSFPKEEQFGLTSQIRRAAVSITSNIAEGFSRSTLADKSHFYIMAYGSLTELQNQLLIARDVNYITAEVFAKIADRSVATQKLISGLIRSIKSGKGVRTELPDTRYKIHATKEQT